MKIFILTDLEGAAGVNRWVQTRDGETPEKHAAMRLLTQEVNAAIDGILDVAPGSEIVVLDGHGAGGLVFEELHREAQVMMRGVHSDKSLGIDDSFDALMFVGQHAMAGVPDAPLCHTFSSRTIEYYRLNGALIGETGFYAARFGELGIPTIFLAGDDKACLEASAIIPGIVTVETKRGMGVEMALHLSAERSREAIRAGAAVAINKRETIEPYQLQPPYELEIGVLEGVDIAPMLKQGECIGERAVLYRADRIADLR